MKSIFLFFLLVGLTIVTVPSALAEGGGGIDCPETLGAYSYVNGSAFYDVLETEQDVFGMLYCEFESFEENTVQFGTIDVIFHVSEELSQQLSDEYGCGEKFGSEMGALYVSSTTHFAAVTFSTSGLQNIVENILSQIEQQSLATICTEDVSNDSSTQGVDEETQEELEEIIKELDEVVEWGSEEEVGPSHEEDPEEIDIELDIEVVLPDWIKGNAEWWASDQITDNDFLLGIEYLITEGIIVIPPTEVSSETTDEIPGWVKFNAGWWAEGQITNSEFIDGLQYLVSEGIISVSS